MKTHLPVGAQTWQFQALLRGIFWAVFLARFAWWCVEFAVE